MVKSKNDSEIFIGFKEDLRELERVLSEKEVKERMYIDQIFNSFENSENKLSDLQNKIRVFFEEKHVLLTKYHILLDYTNNVLRKSANFSNAHLTLEYIFKDTQDVLRKVLTNNL